MASNLSSFGQSFAVSQVEFDADDATWKPVSGPDSDCMMDNINRVRRLFARLVESMRNPWTFPELERKWAAVMQRRFNILVTLD